MSKTYGRKTENFAFSKAGFGVDRRARLSSEWSSTAKQGVSEAGAFNDVAGFWKSYMRDRRGVQIFL
jgi:hypothetical protein